MKIINDRHFFGNSTKILPEDPRTLLQTPQAVSITAVGNGEYWHQGVRNCLKTAFRNINEDVTISLNFNIDGLPIFNCSRIEFWPILFNVFENPQLPVMVAGIFSGKNKSIDVDSYLTPFVDEMNEIMSDGILIGTHKITVLIRCFVCDSPARAFVKGMQLIRVINITYTYYLLMFSCRCCQFQWSPRMLKMYNHRRI